MVQILSPTGIEKPEGGELHSRAQYLRNLDRINQVAIDTDKLPKGIVAYAEMANNSLAFNVNTVATFIASYLFKANRRYRVGASGGGYGTTTTATFNLAISSCNIADGSSLTTGLTQLKAKAIRFDVANEGREVALMAKENLLFTVDTTLQLKLTCGLITGTGQIVLSSDATNRVCLFVEDMGMQF